MTAATATTSPSDPVVDVSVPRRWAILASIVMGSTIYNATILVASGLQPQMQGAMSATQDEIAWTVTFNILATAIVTPMTGWLVARFGARNVMVWSVFTFTVGTLMCGLATSLETLVLLYYSGWSVDRVFRCCVQGMNGIQNAPGASGPTPGYVPEYKKFHHLTGIMRELQTAGAIELGKEPGGKHGGNPSSPC